MKKEETGGWQNAQINEICDEGDTAMKIFQTTVNDDISSTTGLPGQFINMHTNINAVPQGTGDGQRMGRWTITTTIQVEQEITWSSIEPATETGRMQPNYVRSYVFLDTQPQTAATYTDIWVSTPQCGADDIWALRSRYNRERFVLLDVWDTDFNIQAIWTTWEDNSREETYIRKYNSRTIQTNFTTMYTNGTTTPTTNSLIFVTKHGACDQGQAMSLSTNIELEFDDGATTTYYEVVR